MIKKAAVILFAVIAAHMISCGKMQDKLLEINPTHVAKQFFEAWKNKDWKALYQLTHPAFIQRMRLQKLSPEQRNMTDEELFIHEFTRVQRLNPDKVIRSYQVGSVSKYYKGATTVWVSAIVNDKNKKIPLTLDGLSLKVDLTRIE